MTGCVVCDGFGSVATSRTLGSIGEPGSSLESARKPAPESGVAALAAARTRFEALLDAAEARRTPRVSFRELRELGRLYQLHTALLARLRDTDDDPDEIRHLNHLCVRGYALLYAAAPTDRAPLGLRDLLAATWRVQLAAWLLLAAGGLLGAALVWTEPQALGALVPAQLGYSAGGLERLWESPEARAEFFAREATPFSQNAVFGSYLFAHNTRVGITSFATGMLAGIPTVVLQLYNGVILGALSAVFFRDPFPIDYLAWILPHGVPELIALCLCAAAGLLLGVAVAAPGRRSRAEALRDALRPVVLMLGIAAPLFGVAALTESFLRESALGTGIRLAVAGAWIAVTVGFLAWTRRLQRERRGDAAWLDELSIPGDAASAQASPKRSAR